MRWKLATPIGILFVSAVLVLSGCAPTKYADPPKRALILMDCQTNKCFCEFPAQKKTDEKAHTVVCGVPRPSPPEKKPCPSSTQFWPFFYPFYFWGSYGPYGPPCH